MAAFILEITIEVMVIFTSLVLPIFFLCNPSFSEFEIQSVPISSNYRNSTVFIMFQTHPVIDKRQSKEASALSNIGGPSRSLTT